MTIFASILVVAAWLMVGYNLESLQSERSVNRVYDIRSAPQEIDVERMVIYADEECENPGGCFEQGYAMEKPNKD